MRYLCDMDTSAYQRCFVGHVPGSGARTEGQLIDRARRPPDAFIQTGSVVQPKTNR